MDYKEKYEELVEAARAVVEGNPGLCDMNKRLGRVRDLLPEKESEDERIRTRLIALVEAFGQGKYKDEMLAYLEKQKEQKAEWSEKDEIEHDYLCKLLRETWDKVDKGSCIDNAITWFEKLPERIYPHSWKPSEEQIGILGKLFARCQLKDSERDSMVDLFYHLKDMI